MARMCGDSCRGWEFGAETEAETGAEAGGAFPVAARSFGVAARLTSQCIALTSCCASSSGDGGMEGSGEAQTAAAAAEGGRGDLDGDNSAVDRFPFAGEFEGRFSPRRGDTDADSLLGKHAAAGEGTAGMGTAAMLETFAVTVAAFSFDSLLASLCRCCDCCSTGVICVCVCFCDADGVALRAGLLSPTRGFACVHPGDSATGVGVDDPLGAGLPDPRRRPELPMRECMAGRVWRVQTDSGVSSERDLASRTAALYCDCYSAHRCAMIRPVCRISPTLQHSEFPLRVLLLRGRFSRCAFALGPDCGEADARRGSVERGCQLDVTSVRNRCAAIDAHANEACVLASIGRRVAAFNPCRELSSMQASYSALGTVSMLIYQYPDCSCAVFAFVRLRACARATPFAS